MAEKTAAERVALTRPSPAAQYHGLYRRTVHRFFEQREDRACREDPAI